MKQFANQVVTRFGEGKPPSKSVIVAAVSQYFKTGELPEFRTLKLVCYGITTSSPETKTCILETESLLAKLLRVVNGLRSSIRQFRRCFQGLIAAYFAYSPDKDPSSLKSKGWEMVRLFLEKTAATFRADPKPPAWVVALNEHKNLLTLDACKKYGLAFSSGDTDEFDNACASLQIGPNSWVREKVVLAAVAAAINLSDSQFSQKIDQLLVLLKTTPSVRRQGAGQLLDHYAVVSSNTEHHALREESFENFGNPLLISNGPRWASISKDARQMVSNWLKRRVIEQFFELLTQDGSTDKRRVKFWSSYTEAIENIWLVFGKAAQSERNKDFSNLRKLLGDNALRLEGGALKNNAFIMKIGSIYVVEFGEKGNAAYAYRENALPFGLSGSLHLATELKAGSVSLHHRDGLQSWENTFREKLRLPATSIKKPSPSSVLAFERELRAFCVERGLRLEDKRKQDGTLDVFATAGNPAVERKLTGWGFQYSTTRRCWNKP